MSTTPSGESFDTSKYQLPQQEWVCGHLAEGQPCPIGPTGGGECTAARICEPWHDGQAWHCTRARAWGGRCSEGPIPDPECPDQKATCRHPIPACQPKRSLRSQRRFVTGIAIALTLGCCLLILGGSSGENGGSVFETSAIVSPGPLSAHHATMDAGCAACHSAASESPLDLLSCAFGGKTGIDESRRCLECHHQFGDHALMPHSLEPIEIERLTERRNPNLQTASHTVQQSLARILGTHVTTENGEVTCATCHHEHRGASFDLTHMSNSQCQSCHAETFDSFSGGHPEFSGRSRASLHFDHLTHLELHFQTYDRLMPEGIPRDSCDNCHLPDSNEAMFHLASYDTMCGSCHDQQIKDFDMPPTLRLHDLEMLTVGLDQIQQGVSEFAERNSDDESTDPGDDRAAAPGSVYSGWLSGDSSTPMPHFMELLLRGDRESAETMSLLRAATAADNEVQLTQARERFAGAVRNLMESLATNGKATVRARLKASCPDTIDPQLIEACVDALSRSHFFRDMEAWHAVWFEGASGDGPIGHTFGNWHLTDNGQTLVYRCTQHADPVMRSLLDLLAATAADYPERPLEEPKQVLDDFFRDIAALESTGRCIKCHTADRVDDILTINWHTSHGMRSKGTFTRFSHQPHMTLLSSDPKPGSMLEKGVRVCETCHELNQDGFQLAMPGFLLDSGIPDPDDHSLTTLGVNAVRRADCVSCHTPNLAGENCLQCHNYHVHVDTLDDY